MNNEKVTRSWGVAVAIVAAIIGVAAAALSITSMAKAQQTQPGYAPMSVQWQPQSLIETKLVARILKNNEFLKTKLDKLAEQPTEPTEKDIQTWKDEFKNTYLGAPRLWGDKEGGRDWALVLPALWRIVRGSKDISITSISAMIEYVPYDQVAAPAAKDDVDAIIRIRVTFSASPGENVLEGELKHRRVCEIQP